VPHRLAVRDFAGLRLHPGRLAAAGHEVALWPGSVVGTGDPTVLRAKIGYTLFQAHLGELIIRSASRTGWTRTRPGGSSGGRRRDLRCTARRPRRVHRADRVRTRPWCGCGWPAAATSTSRWRTRCMRPPEHVAAALRPAAGLRLRLRHRRAARAGRGGPGRAAAGRHPAVRGEGQRPPGVVRPWRGLRRPGGRLRRRAGLAVAAGARRIVFGGPGKTDAELAAAVAAGAQVNVESVPRAAAPGPGRPGGRDPWRWRSGSTGPGAALPGSHAMTGTPTPFGVDEAQLPACWRWPGCPASGSSASTCTPCRTTWTPPRTPRSSPTPWTGRPPPRAHGHRPAAGQRRRRPRRRLPQRRHHRPRRRCGPAWPGWPPPAST
jgi:hypothetical protein